MNAYLTESEIDIYCTLVAGVSMEHVEAATALIEAHKGRVLTPVEYTERINLRLKKPAWEMRGKLNHYPRISIDKIVGKAQSPFGRADIEYDASALDFDSDDSLYFSFVPPRTMIYHKPPTDLRITYTSGYEEIPDEAKIACGLLASNIKQMGGVLKWKTRDDYDIRVTLADEGIMTNEVKRLLDRIVIQ